MLALVEEHVQTRFAGMRNRGLFDSEQTAAFTSKERSTELIEVCSSIQGVHHLLKIHETGEVLAMMTRAPSREPSSISKTGINLPWGEGHWYSGMTARNEAPYRIQQYPA